MVEKMHVNEILMESQKAAEKLMLQKSGKDTAKNFSSFLIRETKKVYKSIDDVIWQS